MSIFSRIGEAVGVLTAGEQPLSLGLEASIPFESGFAFPQPWVADMFGGMPTGTGKVVNHETASRFTAVAACVQVLEHAVGQIPCELMRKTKDGGAEPATDQPLYEIVKNLFNSEMTAQTGFELSMNHLCYRGNAYHQIVRVNGQVTELNPLQPDWLRMTRASLTGALQYEYTPPGAHTVFEAKDVWRIIGRTRNGLTGISPITENREAIGLGMAAEEHGSKLFANGAQIATAFEHPGKMSKEAQERLRASIQDKYAGSGNAFKTIVIEEGMKVSKVGMTNVDSQFIELRKFQLEEICRIFGIPPHKIQDLARATFNNIEHLTLDFVNSTLMPWLVRFTSTMYRDLLLPNERKRFFFKFDTDSLIQADKGAQANFYASMLTNRIMCPNEVRVKFGLRPYSGGDAFENPNTTSGDAPGDKPGQPIPDPQRG